MCPCYDCNKRTAACHSECTDYIEWHKEHLEKKKAEREEKFLFGLQRGYSSDRYRRLTGRKD